MKNNKIATLTLTGALALSLTACGDNAAAPSPEATPTAIPEAAVTVAPSPARETKALSFPANFSLSVPDAYQDLLTVESLEPDSENDGLFLKVFEKASVEAGEKQHPGEDWGDGWLFSLGVVDEDTLRELSCFDMSGVQPVADMGDGHYIVYYHPTDVRLTREGEITDADMAQWSAVSEWAATVPASVPEQTGYAPYTRTNTDLDMYWNRMLYMPGEIRYTLSSLDYGIDLEPREDVDSVPYLEKLLDGLTVERWEDEDGKFPEGEYTVLNFPEENRWFGFSVADGNIVKENMGDYEIVYRLTYENGTTVAGDVLREWCAALAA